MQAKSAMISNMTLSETLSSPGRRAHGKMPPGTAGSMFMGYIPKAKMSDSNRRARGFMPGVNNN